MTSLCRPGLISILAAVQYISSATKLQAEIEKKKKKKTAADLYKQKLATWQSRRLMPTWAYTLTCTHTDLA